MEPLLKLLWFTGRTGRGRYATTMILLLGCVFGIHYVGIAVIYTYPPLLPFVASAVIVAEFAVVWPQISLCARRLHDLGRSGWWQAVPLAVIFGLQALAEPAWAQAIGLGGRTSEVLGLAALGLYAAFLVALGFIRGMPNANRFGPAPV